AFALVDGLRQVAGLPILAEEAVHAARELREGVHVLDALEDAAIDDRRERVHLGAVVLRDAGDERVEALQHLLEDGAAPEGALDADGDDEPVGRQLVMENHRVELRSRHGIHHSSLYTRSIDAVLAKMRSLLIMRAADSASR